MEQEATLSERSEQVDIKGLQVRLESRETYLLRLPRLAPQIRCRYARTPSPGAPTAEMHWLALARIDAEAAIGLALMCFGVQKGL